MFDLEFLASNSGGFVPVDLGESNLAVGKQNASDALALAPATPAVNSPETRDLANREALGEILDPGYFTQNLESHPSSCQ